MTLLTPSVDLAQWKDAEVLRSAHRPVKNKEIKSSDLLVLQIIKDLAVGNIIMIQLTDYDHFYLN